MAMHLYSTATNKPVRAGDKAITFRGEHMTVIGWPTNGHNRVWLRDADGNEHEFFPAVINAELRNEP